MNDYEYYDYEWIDNSGRNSFELFPVASAVLLAALFGGVGSWAYCRSRDAAFSLVLGLAAIALGCIGLSNNTAWDDDGGGAAVLLVPCGSADAVAGNLGIGILLGVFLAAYVGLMSASAAARRAHNLRQRVYADRGQALTGTVVQKSTKTTSSGENGSTVHFLHVRYRLRGSPSSSGEGLESWAQWSYRSDDDTETETERWTNYDDDSNAALERAYRDDQRFSPAIRDSILVDFSTMVQTDASTGLRRVVRRTTDDAVAAAGWYDDEPAAATTTPGYAGAGDCENVHPFPVTRAVYDREAIGTAVDLLALPGDPFSVALKSEFEPSRCGDVVGGCVAVAFLIMGCWPLPLALGFYLPLRILNHTLCRTSLIVGLSTMVLTVVLLNLGCRCACGRPKGSLTHTEALDTIRQEKNKLLASDEERGLSTHRRKVAVLDSLETAVARHLERHDDHGAATATATQSGLLARHLGRRPAAKSLEEVVTDELFVLTRPQLQIWIRFALYQAELSGGRVPEGTTVVGTA